MKTETNNSLYMAAECKTETTVPNTPTVHSHKVSPVVTTEESGDNGVVVVRRVSGAMNFRRPWKDYVAGFGNPGGNIWIGLEKLHRITQTKSHMLRVDVEDWNGNKYFAEYSHFFVDSAATNYRLSVTGYNVHGIGGDSLTVQRRWSSVHNGRSFSTFDNDNDQRHGRNCARVSKGGWWYDGCFSTNPTGIYYSYNKLALDAIIWYSATGKNEAMKYIQFKIKPVQ